MSDKPFPIAFDEDAPTPELNNLKKEIDAIGFDSPHEHLLWLLRYTADFLTQSEWIKFAAETNDLREIKADRTLSARQAYDALSEDERRRFVAMWYGEPDASRITMVELSDTFVIGND